MINVKGRYAKTALGYAAALSLIAGGIALRAEPPVTIPSPTNAAVATTNSSGTVYNRYLGKFQPTDSTTDETVTNTLHSYLGENAKDWKIALIMPTWYKEHSVKEVVFGPVNTNKGMLPNLRSVYIENGKLLKDSAGKVIINVTN